jgi:universal stress protein E
MLVCVSFCALAHEIAGAACTRLSLRPLLLMRAEVMQSSGALRRENADAHHLAVLTIESGRWAVTEGEVTTETCHCGGLFREHAIGSRPHCHADRLMNSRRGVSPMQILAATDFSTRSNRALRQAGLLARPGNAQLHIVHIVDDDQPDELVRMEKREAERLLNEQTGSMPELRNVQTRLMVVTGDPFHGILRAAAEVNADLIVMGSHRKQLRDVIAGTTIERVIRQGPFPVLMVNNEAQRKYENVLAPVDMVDASADALRVATTTGLISDSRVTLLHAFMPLAKGKMFMGGADQATVDSYVASGRQEVMDELALFLAASVDRIHGRWSLRVEEGGPLEVIARVVSEIQPDLLVMGTNGRSGLLKVLIGSVTEEALRSLNVDILAVSPVKR